MKRISVILRYPAADGLVIEYLVIVHDFSSGVFCIPHDDRASACFEGVGHPEIREQFVIPVPHAVVCYSPRRESVADFMQDAEDPVAFSFDFRQIPADIRMAVPEDRIAGERPVSGFHARSGEHHDVPPVVRTVADQIDIAFVDLIQVCKPCIRY